ncbi:hypothetical protein, partial [Sutterella wadsworthensis]|uniref:hypothetical protein n=1 Tax=Sutterella wadsworthensis TaxID=40545 RepID=UPI003A8D53BD
GGLLSASFIDSLPPRLCRVASPSRDRADSGLSPHNHTCAAGRTKKSLAGVFPSPARLNPQFSQPKVRRNYSGNLFSHQNSAVRKLYLENTSAGFTECSRGATKGDASFDMLMTAANEGRRLFAAKDCSAAGRCRVTGFQRPFEQQKKTSQAFSRRPRGSTLNFLNLKSGETR